MILHSNDARRPGSTSLTTLILALIAIGGAAGVIALLVTARHWIYWFIPRDPSAEFVYWRLKDPFGWWVIVAPIGFTFVVLWIVLFFRQSKSLSELLGILRFPSVLI